jgi:hypothetical protein
MISERIIGLSFRPEPPWRLRCDWPSSPRQRLGGGEGCTKMPSLPAHTFRSLAVAFGTPSRYRLRTGYRRSSIDGRGPATNSLQTIAAIRSSPMPPPRSAMDSRIVMQKPWGVCVAQLHRPSGWTHMARPVGPRPSSCHVLATAVVIIVAEPFSPTPRTPRTGRCGGDISSRNGIKDPYDRRCGRIGTPPCHTVAGPACSTPERASRGVVRPPPSRGHRPRRSRHARSPCRAVSPSTNRSWSKQEGPRALVQIMSAKPTRRPSSSATSASIGSCS